jgi:hypothetical protein
LSEPIKNSLNVWNKAGELGKPLMDMTLAEMDVLGRGEAQKKEE